MVSVWVPIILFLIGIVALAVTSVLAIIAAGNVYGSDSYGGSRALHSAHSYLTTAATLGVITVVIAACVVGGMVHLSLRDGADIEKLKKLIARKDKLTAKELSAVIKESKAAQHFIKSLRYFLFAIGVVLLMEVVLGVLCAFAASKLASGPKDSNVQSAYTQSIIAAIIGVPTVILAVLSVSSGFKVVGDANRTEARADKQLTAKTKDESD